MEFPAGTVLLDEHFGTAVINATDVDNTQVYEALGQQDRELFNALSQWVNSARPSLSGYAAEGLSVSGGRNGSLVHRDRYLTPTNVFDQMRTAYAAIEQDDVVSGIAETTEALAFSSVSFFAEDEDDQDVYNQIAASIDLDSRLREMWRELFTVSQFYLAAWSAPQSFKVRGTTKDGNRRRKVIDCVAPKELTLLDPMKVVPVGISLFGQEQLAYRATVEESAKFDDIVGSGRIEDPIVRRLISGRYQVERSEERELAALGINIHNLWTLNPQNVFRHTLTRPGYQRFSPVRMRSVFPLLDLKEQLRQNERVFLLGGTNYIVLVTKGTDQHPALPAEITNLQSMVRTVAKVPILVGDHRLHVEIITPKMDQTLTPERWATLDSRITARLYQMFMLGSTAGARTDDSTKLVKVIARGMESRRHMIRRALEKYVLTPLYENNDELHTAPKLQFHPRAIALDFDAAWASFLFDLRTNNEISRETILSQFDLDQELEAEYRRRETELYDDIFRTQVAFSAPNPALPGQPPPPGAPVPPGVPTTRDNGGGRRQGGGAAPGSGQGQPARRPTQKSDGGRPTAAANPGDDHDQ